MRRLLFGVTWLLLFLPVSSHAGLFNAFFAMDEDGNLAWADLLARGTYVVDEPIAVDVDENVFWCSSTGYFIKYSRDGSRIFTILEPSLNCDNLIAENGTIQVWGGEGRLIRRDTAGNVVCELEDTDRGINDATFLPDAGWALSLGRTFDYDGAIRFYDEHCAVTGEYTLDMATSSLFTDANQYLIDVLWTDEEKK